MITNYDRVSLRPQKPLLIWDGDCSFCKYWMLRWKKQTKNLVRYEPYQKVAGDIPGIPEWAFKEAIRLIETDGKVYDGAHAAYQALTYADKWNSLSEKYDRSAFFRYISDHGYAMVAKNRNSLFWFTKLAWGKNPATPKNYWIAYLLGIGILVILVFVLSDI